MSTQPPEDATTDSQLASIVLSLSERIGKVAAGAVVDIGCGQGTLLRRIFDLPHFKNNLSWIYIGIDDAHHLAKVQELARQLKINRKVEVIDLNDFYDKWPDVPDFQIVVCRNVLHELRIVDTEKLIQHVFTSIRASDTFIIQDLIRFPVSERHNACWIPEKLQECLREIGFHVQPPVVQGTRNGNAYFNVISGRNTDVLLNANQAKEAVKNARFRQWQIWMEIENQSPDSLPARDDLIEALDIDLQVTALTRQLLDVGMLQAVLAPDIERRVRTSEFTKLVEGAVDRGLTSQFQIEEKVHFRERGAQLDILEKFLRGSGKLAVVHGGSGYGKTTLVHRLLATRSYGKLVVEIDGRRIKNAWAFIEEMFTQLGIRLAPEQLSVLGNLSLEAAEPTIRRLLNKVASNLIVFYDNFDVICNVSGEIEDPELASVLSIILSKERIKVIIGSRREYPPRKIIDIVNEAPATVRVGRYATDSTVTNIIDDYFNRSASGLSEYPQSLLDAIDRHPLITVLAARALQRAGAGLLLDQSFVNELSNKLRDELWGRIVGPDARSAVLAAASLRVLVPIVILEGLSEKASISAAQEEEVIYSQPDQRWGSIWSTIGLFKLKNSSQDEFEDENNHISRPMAVDHSKVASLYRYVYQKDDDPKWIRESYYHQLLSVDGNLKGLSEGAGKYYYDELVASADYHYVRSRNFKSALDLYSQALLIRPLNQTSEMRRASCLIRLGDKRSGEKAYKNLVEQAPAHLGIKTSHVDATLYRGEYEEAIRILSFYGLNHESEWVEWQWGRAYLGLDQYESALSYLNKIVVGPNDDSHYYIYLARAQDYAGDFAGALKTLRDAKRKFQTDVGVGSALGVELEKFGEYDEAESILRPLFEKYSDNIYAASVLVKILIRSGSVTSARPIIMRAVDAAPPTLGHLAVCMQADFDVAEGRPEVALARLLKISEPDPTVCITTLEVVPPPVV
nr:methyltransferase domain-containing protein [Methylosinus sp. RM1]